MAVAELAVNVVANAAGFARTMADIQKSVKKTGQFLTGMGQQISKISVPLAALGTASVMAFGEFEKLENGLTAIMGSSEGARKELTELRKVAENPGLALPNVVKASATLQSVGMSADGARKTILEFGNAVARASGTPETFSGVVLALSQISAVGKVTQEDLNQIKERLPEFARVMKEEFGVVTAEAIRGLGIGSQEFIERSVQALARLERAKGGIANSFDNLKDTVQGALADIGRAISENLVLEKVFADIGSAVQGLANWFTNLSPGMQEFIIKAGAIVTVMGPLLIGLGSVVTSIAALIPLLTTLGGYIATVGSGLASFGAMIAPFLLNPIGLLAAAVAGLAYLFPETFNAIVDTVVAFAIRVGEILTELVNVPLALFGTSVQEIAVLVGEWIGKLPDAFSKAFDAVGETISGGIKVWKLLFTSLYEAVSGILSKLWDLISNWLSALANKLGVAAGAIELFSENGANAVRRLQKAIELTVKPLDVYEVKIDSIADASKNLSESQKDAAQSLGESALAFKKNREEAGKQEQANSKLAKTNTGLFSSIQEVTEETKKGSKASAEAKLRKQEEAKAAKELRERLSDVRDEMREQEQAYNDLAENANRAFGEYSDIANGIADLITGAEGKGFGELLNVLGGGRPEGISGPLLPDGSFSPDRIFGMDAKEMGEYSQAIEAVVAGAEKWAKIGKSAEETSTGIGSAAGTAIGSIWGPEGARIGESVGSMIGEMVGGLFGGESKNAGKKARKEFISGFNEMIAGKGIMIFDSEGVARQFNQLISVGDSYFDQAGWGDKFGEMAGQAFGAFQGVGLALGGIFGTGGEVAGQIGAMLFESLQSVENLGMAIAGLNIPIASFEDALLQALEQGQIGLREYVIALQGVREAFGVAEGATGDLNKAFELLIGTGGDSIQTMRMFERIIQLAMNQGIKSVDELIEVMRQGGKFTEEQLSALASAFAAHGISAMDQLEDAATETLASILVFLSSLAEEGGANFFELADSANQAFNEIAEGAENLGREVSNVSNDSVSVAASAGATPSAMGNVFSAGGIMPFMNGGVVKKMSLFDIGSIAERGPEAILPLERLPDGRLGVLASGSASSGESVVVNVDARGAEIGAAVRIKREIENYFDRRNRAPGRVL